MKTKGKNNTKGMAWKIILVIVLGLVMVLGIIGRGNFAVPTQ